MKILLAGCEKRFSVLQSALNDNRRKTVVCLANKMSIADRNTLAGNRYDWVILDGRMLKGRKDFAFLFERQGCPSHKQGAAESGDEYPHCGVEVTENGTMQLSCRLHKMACDANIKSNSGQPQSSSSGFIFEYQSSCKQR